MKTGPLATVTVLLAVLVTACGDEGPKGPGIGELRSEQLVLQRQLPAAEEAYTKGDASLINLMKLTAQATHDVPGVSLEEIMRDASAETREKYERAVLRFIVLRDLRARMKKVEEDIAALGEKP